MDKYALGDNIIKVPEVYDMDESKSKTDWAYFIKYSAGLLALFAILYFVAKFIIPIIWSLIR